MTKRVVLSITVSVISVSWVLPRSAKLRLCWASNNEAFSAAIVDSFSLDEVVRARSFLIFSMMV